MTLNDRKCHKNDLFLDEDEVERPFICPMCRLIVIKLIWKGSDQLIPNELLEYNQLFQNYKPQARQTSQKYSSG